MARWKKRHLGRHRHRYHRRLLSTPLGACAGSEAEGAGSAAEGTGSVAEGAVSRRQIKYAALDHSYTFISLAFETYGTIDNKGIKFLH